MRGLTLVSIALFAIAAVLLIGPPQTFADRSLDAQLTAVLNQHGFTGRINSTLEQRLGRNIDNQLADLGRLLFFDTVTGLNNDNNCSGCHAPTNAFGDTQSIAIGVDNNGIVGPDRTGPRNQRRTPSIINSAFFPTLMWNSRFASLSGDPFDNSMGFIFPLPEGLTLSYQPHLLVAQAFIPPTERVEVAGFLFPGDNFDIRDEVLRRINDVPEYRKRFGKIFPAVNAGGPITFDMFGLAIAEFEFTLAFADAPIDRFARGQKHALTDEQKNGALLLVRLAVLSVMRCPARRMRCSAISNNTSSVCRRSRRRSATCSSMDQAKTRTLASSRLLVTRRIVTCFERLRSATWLCSRRFFTTVRSRNWRTRYDITWMFSCQLATTRLPRLE